MEIYLDNSATTKPCREAVEACLFAMETEYGNPSSLHQKGLKAELLQNRAREQLAEALECRTDELWFTSGATESNNLALFGAAGANARRGKTILTTAIEHPSVLEPLAELERQGFRIVRLMPGSDGTYTPEQFAQAVDEDTILVSCMQVNNETGLILPVAEIARAVKRKKTDILVHVDAVQAFLKLPIKLKHMPIDLLSVSGHKVHAPKGIGALYCKKGVRILPRVFGGGQQGGIRSGTEPVELISAFGAAVAAQSGRIRERAARDQALRDYLCGRLAGEPGIVVHNTARSLPHIVHLSVMGVRSEIMLHHLERYGIYVSSGSACARGKQSHVLAALGMDRASSDSALRISFGADTNEAMLDELALRLREGRETLAKTR